MLYCRESPQPHSYPPGGPRLNFEAKSLDTRVQEISLAEPQSPEDSKKISATNRTLLGIKRTPRAMDNLTPDQNATRSVDGRYLFHQSGSNCLRTLSAGAVILGQPHHDPRPHAPQARHTRELTTRTTRVTAICVFVMMKISGRTLGECPGELEGESTVNAVPTLRCLALRCIL